jgi:DNA polymerase epsilon subunit 1
MLSKDLKEYDVGRKGVAITAGKRMAEFLGADTVKGPGLNCTFVISKKPISEPIA